MGEVARIHFSLSKVFMSADSPYERELLFDFVERSAKVYGVVDLLLDGRLWKVSLSAPKAPVCTICRRAARGAVYQRTQWTLCARCAHASYAAALNAPTVRRKPPARKAGKASILTTIPWKVGASGGPHQPSHWSKPGKGRT